MPQIESLLAARLFLAPQLVDGRLYFVSDLSGRLSLYVMDARPGGSVPEPLLPPHVALQNPHLIGGFLFYVFPKLGRILVMLDRDGDENYQPMWVPLGGGFPEPAFGEQLAGYRCHLGKCDPERNLAYLAAEARGQALNVSFRADLAASMLTELARSEWGLFPDGANADHSRVTLIEGYTAGDIVLYLWQAGETRLLYGQPLDQRAPGEAVPLSAISASQFTPEDRGLLFITGLFDDAYGLGYLSLAEPGGIRPVTITGAVHTGLGELTGLDQLADGRYTVAYNIDGCSWLYEAAFDEAQLTLTLERVLCGAGPLAGGVLESSFYDKASGTHSLSFSTATAPTQLFTVARAGVTAQTRQRVLGLPETWLSAGEDASFTSHDGLRVSARLYRPAPALGWSGPRPLVYYIHGGPQSQERPDFAWFSMPLIQFLTLSGFAVFVPNVRGSTGYGLSYMKRVDRDWGGQDRLDHVHAMTQVLPRDPRLDTRRAGVVGRSYGGYMTLTLAARHPELWSAAADMFGPYDLHTFIDRLPESWKPYFRIAVGDPASDGDFLRERSPATYIAQVTCPLLVIQGQNDPRVIERESRDVVERLRAQGRAVEYLVFENEGHDVLKFENKVRCYNTLTQFFQQHLRP